MPEKDKPLTERERNLQQVPIRLHVNDYRAVKKLFIDEGWSFQKFVAACVDMYLKRDPLFLKTIADWQAENATTKKNIERYTHSKREAQALLDEIEEANEE